MGLSSAVSVWLEADLTQYTAHRPSVLYRMGRPGQIGGLGSGAYVCVRPWNERVLLFGYDPTKDLNVACVMQTMKRAGIETGEHTNLHRWLAACSARPALARARARP